MNDYLWKDIQVRDYFIVQQNNCISDVDKRVIFSLYQPIIGAHAVAIYTYFLENSRIRQQYRQLFAMLQMNAQQFYEARIRLEAMGLVKTYYTEQEDLDKYVYEVLPPVSAYTFFSDFVYRSLLIDRIGTQQFDYLKTQFSVQTYDLSAYQHVSKSFQSLFKYDIQHITDVDVSNIVGQDRAMLAESTNTFDWTLLSQLLTGLYITPQHLNAEVKKAIQALYDMYGIEAFEMKSYLLQAHSITDDAINVDKLFQLARQQQTNSVVLKQAKAPAIVEAVSKENSTLIQLCYDLTPVRFLETLKKQAGGYVTASELQLVELFVRQQILAPAVMNVLIHYMLVVKQMATLNKAFAETIANDWLKEGVDTPEKAMQRVEQLVSDSEKRTAPKRKGKPVQRVTMSEEEKQALNGSDTPIDEKVWQEALGQLWED